MQHMNVPCEQTCCAHTHPTCTPQQCVHTHNTCTPCTHRSLTQHLSLLYTHGHTHILLHTHLTPGSMQNYRKLLDTFISSLYTYICKYNVFFSLLILGPSMRDHTEHAQRHRTILWANVKTTAGSGKLILSAEAPTAVDHPQPQEGTLTKKHLHPRQTSLFLFAFD